MKTKIIITFLFIFLSRLTLLSDCPINYSALSTQITTTDGCLYNVDICFICIPQMGSNFPGEIHVIGFSRDASVSCNPSLTTTEILLQIYTQLNTISFLMSICKERLEIEEPCNENGGVYFHYAIDICWQKSNINGTIYYHPCLDGNVLCREEWKWCWDPILGRWEKERTYGPVMSGNYWCPGDEPDDPTIGNVSECFHLDTDCSNQYPPH